MLLPSSPGSLRPIRCGTAGPDRRRQFVALGLIGWLVLAWTSGCATFGKRGPAAEKLAAGHELLRLGVAAMEMGQWRESETLLQRSLEAAPDDAETRRYMAEALWHRGAQESALAQVAAAIQLSPNDAKLAVRAGEMSLAAGAREAAIAHADQAIRLDPQLGEAWALRGRIFWQLNQPDRALADLQRALEFAPASADVLLDVAVMYRERGQPERCLTTLHQLHDTYAPGEVPQTALLLEGLALLDISRPQQAADVLLAAIGRGVPNAELLYYLAQAQSAAGRYAEATAAANEALKIDASHQASRQLLAQLAAQTTPTAPQPR